MKRKTLCNASLSVVMILLYSVLLHAQAGAGKGKKRLPRFEDYPVVESWKGSAAPLKLLSSSDRMFRTQFREAAKKPPDFAGHFRFTDWGCGTQCLAGGIVDFKTGRVFPLPLSKKVVGWEHWIYCASHGFDTISAESRVNSQLMVVRCGLNFDDDDNSTPDVYYFLWENDHFRRIAFVRGKGKHVGA